MASKRQRIKILETQVSALCLGMAAMADLCGKLQDQVNKFIEEFPEAVAGDMEDLHDHLEGQMDVRMQKINAPLN